MEPDGVIEVYATEKSSGMDPDGVIEVSMPQLSVYVNIKRGIQ